MISKLLKETILVLKSNMIYVYKGGTWEYIKFFPFPFYPLDFGLDPWFGANNISLKRNVFTPHLVNL